MKDSALVLQHEDDAGGGLLLEVLEAQGIDYDVVRVDRGATLIPPRSLAFAVVLGAEASAARSRLRPPAWLAAERSWLHAALRASTPVLGLGFGAHALVRCLGGAVHPHVRAEHGWVQVSSGDPERIGAGPWPTWHNDVMRLPVAAQLLAYNDWGPQVFCHGPHVGVQFHPEATPEMLAAHGLGEAPGGEQRHLAAGYGLLGAFVRSALTVPRFDHERGLWSGPA